jgi:hypothetical protein
MGLEKTRAKEVKSILVCVWFDWIPHSAWIPLYLHVGVVLSHGRPKPITNLVKMQLQTLICLRKPA